MLMVDIRELLTDEQRALLDRALAGSGGLLRAHNQHATTVEKANADGFASDPALHFFLERYTAAYRAEMDTFVAGVSQGKPLVPTGEDGLKALVLADAAEESAKSGKSVRVS